ncbi:hypothetical protein [Kocuria marina]|uniref:hypothetical protein n=1 Tax=Kocuria marina TaxID=223184 RepID=UPI0022E7B370|nr:hypothetical protein [Kocuria marina]
MKNCTAMHSSREIFVGGLNVMRANSSAKSVLSAAELGTLNQLMRGGGTLEPFERELVTRVFVGARAWLQEQHEGAELTRDQRKRWNAAVRYINRHVSRGGVAMSWRVLRSLDGSTDLLADHHVLKTAIVAAAAHGPVTAAEHTRMASALMAPPRPAARLTTSVA